MGSSDFVSLQKTNKHIGFIQGAPDDACWSNAYVQTVAPNEQREMCKTATFVFLSAIILFFVLLSLPLIANLLKDHVPFLDSKIWIIIVPFIIFSGFLLSIASQFVTKWIFISKVNSRAGKSFDPSEGIVVSIEDAFTYDKSKLVVEDFGLLKILPDCILLEMTRHRARFDRAGLSVSLLHTAKKLAGIRLTYNQSPYLWTVVICPIANVGLSSGFTQSAAKSKALLKIFTEMGYQAQPQPEIKPVSSLPAAQTTTTVSQNISLPVEQVEHADILDVRYQNIKAEIDKKINGRKKSWLKNIGILLVSLFIFFQLGFFKWGLESVLLIILVLFIHEMGHFLSMKMFGYKNLQMFFIPLFGAAVSGVSCNVAAWKKAIVSLMGPLPGIFISVVLLVAALITKNKTYLEAGSLFLLINAFNLLPITPLDGGRFLHELLFSRNRYVEMVVNILASIAFFALAAATHSWLFRILGIISLLSIQVKFKIAAAADKFKKQFQTQNENHTDDSIKNDDQEYIPEHILKSMLSWMHQNMPGPMKPKDIATMAIDIWDRIRVRPPKLGATILLLVLFFVGYFVSFASFGLCAVGFYRNAKVKSKIVAYQDPNQNTYYKEQQSLMGVVQAENQLSEGKQLYHGFHKAYYGNKSLSEEGWWNMGKRTGRWSYYDPNSQLTEEIIYREGIPVSSKSLENGQWEERRWEDYADWEKEIYQSDANQPQGPAKESAKDDTATIED
jgi:Zn-dependent protease